MRGCGRVLVYVVAALTVAIGVSACADDPPPVSPREVAAQRLGQTRAMLDAAGAIKLSVRMEVSSGNFATYEGTAWLVLGTGEARSRATAHVDILGVGVDDSMDVELVDMGNGTTYLKAPGVATQAKPWREITSFATSLVEGPVGVIAYSELLNSVVLDPREYLVTDSVIYSSDADSPLPVMRGQCQQALCRPGDRLTAWLEAHSPEWSGVSTVMRLDANNALSSFDVMFYYSTGPTNRASVSFHAKPEKEGTPVTVEAPPSIMIVNPAPR
jgi:hypothetical protein